MANRKLEINQFEATNRRELRKELRKIRASIGSQEYVADLFNQVQESISRYENGSRHAPLTYISKLARKAGLPFIEEQYLLGLAGASIPTRMPSAEQISKDMEVYCRDIMRDWYPSIIVDHNFGIWVMNQAAYDVLGELRTKEIMGQYVTILEMLFSGEIDYNLNNLVYEAVTNDPQQTRLQQIALFKLVNMQRRHEAFYRNYPKHLGYIGKDSPRIHRNAFVHFWNQVDTVGARGSLQFKGGSVEITGVLPSREAVDIRYHQRIEPIPHLPMFCIIRFEPLHQFHYIFARYKWVSEKLIKLWEITPIEPIIQGIDSLNLIEPA